MKTNLIAVSLLALSLGSISSAQAIDENPLADQDNPGPMSLFEQNELVTEKFNQALAEIQTHEMFAGRKTEINFRGKSYIIDRSMEAVKSKPGVAVRPTNLGSLIGDISARTSGSLKIKVTQEQFTKDGKLESRETWEIDVGGTWQAQTGMTDATGKAHK